MIDLKLTKKQKHELYKACVTDIEKYNKICCCISFQNNLMKEIINLKLNVFNFLLNAKYNFTELYDLRTVKEPTPTGYWFETKEERIKALKKCIEQTK